MGSGPAGGSAGGRLSSEADALLTLRRLCQEYHALPSQVLAEDGPLMLHLLEIEGIVRAAEDAHAREAAGEPMDYYDDETWGEVSGG